MNDWDDTTSVALEPEVTEEDPRDSAYLIVIAGTTVPLFNQSTTRLQRDLRLTTRRDRRCGRPANAIDPV